MKVGQKLRLIKQTGKDNIPVYERHGYKIGDIVVIDDIDCGTIYIKRLRDNDDSYCIPEDDILYISCWEPVAQSMKELLE